MHQIQFCVCIKLFLCLEAYFKHISLVQIHCDVHTCMHFLKIKSKLFPCEDLDYPLAITYCCSLGVYALYLVLLGNTDIKK